MNATETPITEATPTGPSYLLNTLSNADCWYQIDVQWKWSGESSPNKFQAGLNIFCNGKVVFPPPKGPCDEEGADENFSGPVNPGDKVEMSITLHGDEVYMTATDLETGATANLTYSAEGATEFVGTPDAPSTNDGFFTGLMTEQYFPDPYYGNVNKEAYTTVGSFIPSAEVWTSEDEFETSGTDTCVTGTTKSIYNNEVDFPIDPTPFYIQTAFANGSGPGEEYFENGTLITGVNEIAGPSFSKPSSVVFSPDGLYAYITNQGNGTISVVDVDEGAIVNTISLGGQTPWAIAINPAGTTLYVSVQTPVNNAGQATSSIDIIDTLTRTITGSIPLPSYASLYSGLPEPNGATETGTPITSLVVNPSGTYAYGTSPWVLLYKIDLVSNAVVDTEVDTFDSGPDGQCIEINPAYDIGDTPGSIAMDPTGSYLYIQGEEFSGYFGNSTLCGTPETLTGGSPEVLQINTQTLGLNQAIDCAGNCNVGSDGAIAISSTGLGAWGGWGGGGNPIYGFLNIPYGGFTRTTWAPVAMAFEPPYAGQPLNDLYAVMCSEWQYGVGTPKLGPPPSYTIEPQTPMPGESAYIYADGVEIPLSGCPATTVTGSNTWANQVLQLDPNDNLNLGYVTNYYANNVIVLYVNYDSLATIPAPPSPPTTAT